MRVKSSTANTQSIHIDVDRTTGQKESTNVHLTFDFNDSNEAFVETISSMHQVTKENVLLD